MKRRDGYSARGACGENRSAVPERRPGGISGAPCDRPPFGPRLGEVVCSIRSAHCMTNDSFLSGALRRRETALECAGFRPQVGHDQEIADRRILIVAAPCSPTTASSANDASTLGCAPVAVIAGCCRPLQVRDQFFESRIERARDRTVFDQEQQFALSVTSGKVYVGAAPTAQMRPSALMSLAWTCELGASVSARCASSVCASRRPRWLARIRKVALGTHTRARGFAS